MRASFEAKTSDKNNGHPLPLGKGMVSGKIDLVMRKMAIYKAP